MKDLFKPSRIKTADPAKLSKKVSHRVIQDAQEEYIDLSTEDNLQIECQKDNTIYMHSDQSQNIELDISKNTKLTFVHFIETINQTNHLNLNIHLNEYSHLNYIAVSNSSTDSAIRINTDLSAPNSESNIKFCHIGKGESQTDIRFTNNSQSSQTTGNISVNSILHDKASAQIQGLISVQKNASNVISNFSQKTLLASPNTHCTNIPLMGITGNQVQASHSCSIYRLSPEDLYYLASRGIGEREAQDLIQENFINSVLQSIINEDLQQKIAQAL